MMSPNEVHSRDDLTGYLNDLSRAISGNQHKIENVRTDDFIEALAAWIADMDGYFANQGVESPREGTWQLMAMAITAGLVYE